MKIEQWDVEKVIPYDRNPRINDGAVESTAKSIETFGFRQPIVVDAKGVIVVGHTRLKAALSLGMETVPVHVAELTEAEAMAYRIADNKTGELAEWDDDLLAAEFAALKDLDFDLDLTGFDLDEPGGVTAGGAEGAGGGGIDPGDQFGVIVICENEAAQEAAYNELAASGYNCKVVCV